MGQPAITSVFNDGYIAEQYEAYRRDPAAVDESWRQYFRAAERLGGAAPAATGDADLARKAAGAASLAAALRTYGHLAVRLDPLGDDPPGAAELDPGFHGISEPELADVPGAALGFPHMATAAEVIARLRLRYTTRLGLEYTHLEDEDERAWFRALLTAEQLTRPLSRDERVATLRRLTEVDGLERFLAKAFVGYKRFSIEGTDALVPMLDTAIGESAAAGARRAVIGMAHRGRLNVLVHVLGKPAHVLFGEFEGKHAHDEDVSTGDVKYHLGYDGVRETAAGAVRVELLPNPSHLEFVNPVVEGYTRAVQRAADGARDEAAVVPILVHGDAAFPGQGIVPETLNLSRLDGYRVGGTLHVIVNNQVGFTTDPADGRSTQYASDIAKGFEIPILHVNADDPEACIIAMRIAAAYRARFRKDFLIDLVGYRRWGHNEGDEPAFTQPLRYDRIKAHPTPRQVWASRLVGDGTLTQGEVDAIEAEVMAAFAAEHEKAKALPAPAPHAAGGAATPTVPAVPTVAATQLVAWNERLLRYPGDLTPHPRLAKQLERRRDALGEAGGIDWGHAETLALASLLAEGTHVRLTGEDVQRGTFSHRHAVLTDVRTGRRYAPLAHLGTPGTFEIHNSALSETAVMGFEYGFSVAAADTLVLWEAQFGDFANVAQPIIDQFLAADRAKWGQDSGLVLLLPHGYEGQGPEHSSARLERFLQLCAEGNLRVAYPTTAAQYYHVLRRQARLAPRRPLVLMQPKSMLRLPAATSRLEDLATGGFRVVLDDPASDAKRASVTRLVFCSGKVYHDLVAKDPGPQVAVVRVEELAPWPQAELAAVVDRYPNVEEAVWAQEEPKNMGAWSYAAPLLRVSVGNALALRYAGRPERASPAEGYPADHQVEQARIVAEATTPAPARRKATAGRP
jgi:2-oxoglutarate dehydrogenase E1 component